MVYTAFIKTNQQSFNYNLDEKLNDITLVKITNFKLPVSFYNITSNNNKFTIILNNVMHNTVITPGQYDIDALLNTLNGLFVNNVSLTYSETSRKIVITAPNTFTIAPNDSLNEVLGFTTTQNIISAISANTYQTTATAVVDLSPKNVYLISRHLNTHSEIKGQRVDVLYEANINTNFGSIFIDANHNAIPIKIASQNSLSKFHFELVDIDLNPINLNGAHYSFCVQFF